MSQPTPGAYQHNPHRWGPPPPGSGATQVCTQCGERDLPTVTTECVGPRAATVDPTSHDYEPIL